MSLADELRALSGRSLASLDDCHDYFTYTKRLWRLLDQVVDEGRGIEYRNPDTGSRVTGPRLVELSHEYIATYLQSDFFQKVVSLFEDFFFDLARLWMTAYPDRLKKKQVDFATILTLRDPDAIAQMLIDQELNSWKYQRIAEWFAKLNHVVRLGCTAEDEIARLAEMKASRDLADDDGPGGFGEAADLVAGICADPGAVRQSDTDKNGLFETDGQFIPVMIE